jgi:FAD:protein FMN transferase
MKNSAEVVAAAESRRATGGPSRLRRTSATAPLQGVFRTAAAVALLWLVAPLGASAAAVTIERRLGLMGTELRLLVEADSRDAALAASEAAVRALEATEDRLSTWNSGSELARVNAGARGERVPISADLWRELERAAWCTEITGGSFDAGIGALIEAWDLRGAGRVPAPRERRAAVAAGGMRRLRLDGRAAVRTAPGLRIEEGGFGKGAGLDAALAALAASPHVLRAELDLGGQVAVLRGSALVEIAHPDQRDRIVAEVTLDRGSLSTSGNNEHGIVVNGRRFGHLLDARSGRPAPDFGSLAVWAPSALDADCLSTGLFVMGSARALRWARAHPEVEVLVLRRRRTGVVVEATAGWRGRLRPAAGVGVTWHGRGVAE